MNAGPRDPSDNPEKKSGAPSIGRSVSLMDNRIQSRELFAATREILIIHGDETYRLRLTAQNKLILTK
jgi:hemin uptake protein HemP